MRRNGVLDAALMATPESATGEGCDLLIAQGVVQRRAFDYRSKRPRKQRLAVNAGWNRLVDRRVHGYSANGTDGSGLSRHDTY